MRHDGRKAQELRKLELQTNVFKYPEGSVVIRFGDTTVICSATIENSVPPFLRETGTGWVTAEYSMLPRATSTRNRRESSKGKLSGRTMEIQRQLHFECIEYLVQLHAHILLYAYEYSIFAASLKIPLSN